MNAQRVLFLILLAAVQSCIAGAAAAAPVFTPEGAWREAQLAVFDQKPTQNQAGGQARNLDAPRAPAAPAYTFDRGVFIHHWLVMPLARVQGSSRVPHTYGARWFNLEDFRWLGRHGFDHVQIPVELALWVRPDGSLDDSRIEPFERALEWGRRTGLGVVATFVRPPKPPGVAADSPTDNSDPAQRAISIGLARRLAARFAPVGAELRFLFPAGALSPRQSPAAHDAFVAELLTAIRREDRDRFVYVEAVRRREGGVVADPDASFEHLADLHLPADPRVGVSVVYSEPEIFTWQRFIAEMTDTVLPPILFPGSTPDFAALGLAASQHPAFAHANQPLTVADIHDDFERLARWQRTAGAGRPIYLAHFGARDTVDPASTRRYVAAVVAEAARLGLGWSIYNYDTASGLRDPRGEPTALYAGLGLQPEAPARPAAATSRQAATFRKGVNLAHWLSFPVPPDFPYGGSWFDQEDVAWVASQGFDHLRVRVAGEDWIDGEGRLIEAAIAPFDDLLAWAEELDLGVVLSMYSLPGVSARLPAGAPSAFADPGAVEKAVAWWRQVALRYAGQGRGLRFELLHRPRADNAADLAAFQRLALAAIRASNPSRVVYLTSRGMSQDTLSELVLDDPHTAVAVDFWEPRVFTTQYDPTGRRPLVPFPGTVPDPAGLDLPEDDPLRRLAGTELTPSQIDDRLDQLVAWAQAHAGGRELHVAEFGVQDRAEDDSRRRWTTHVRQGLDRRGLSWAVYDYASGCAVRGEDGTPTVILEALFPRPETP